MCEVAFIPKGAVTCHLEFSTQFRLPVNRLRSHPWIQARTCSSPHLRLIIAITLPHGQPWGSNTNCRGLSKPPWVIPKLWGTLMEEVTPIPIWALLPIVEFLAQFHLVDYFLVIIPIIRWPVIILSGSHKFLPVGRWLPHVLGPMGKVTILAIPTRAHFELCAHSCLEENVCSSSVGGGIRPWVRSSTRWILIKIPGPLKRRLRVIELGTWVESGIRIKLVVAHWELRPISGRITVMLGRRWHMWRARIRQTHRNTESSNLIQLAHGCEYQYDVSGEGAKKIENLI